MSERQFDLKRRNGASVTAEIDRRAFLRRAVAGAMAFPMVNLGSHKLFASSEVRYSARAVDLVMGNQVFDMLSIMAPLGPMMLSAYGDNPKRTDTYNVPSEQVALLLSSGVDVFHPAVGLKTAEEVAGFIARLNAYAAEYPEVFQRIDAISDLDTLRKGERVGYIIGVQNSDHFQEVDDVNLYYSMGQRVSQLTYNSTNLIGTGATEEVDLGLSEYGHEVVGRMGELGMAIDVSHCGDQTTLDAFSASSKPVLITHSNVRVLAGGHVRCKSDEAIRAVAKSGSVMGITGVRNFVSDKEPTTLENILDHIDYVARLAGVEHVGIGSDMDMHGYDDIPEPAYSALKSVYKSSYVFRDKLDTDGFDHPKRIFDLTEGLIRRGYTDEHIGMILGANFRRVLGEIWQG
ncbi:MAG: membrane dipeptidase [Alphaproteobacteria bacterium]|nr:membrane dipeptidase [Alphaproteobacteria bacterium]